MYDSSAAFLLVVILGLRYQSLLQNLSELAPDRNNH